MQTLLKPFITCREVERYRRFGELCNTAQKEGQAEYGFVFALLKEIGGVLEVLGDIQDQTWFQTVSYDILLVPVGGGGLKYWTLGSRTSAAPYNLPTLSCSLLLARTQLLPDHPIP